MLPILFVAGKSKSRRIEELIREESKKAFEKQEKEDRSFIPRFSRHVLNEDLGGGVPFYSSLLVLNTSCMAVNSFSKLTGLST